MGDITEEVPVVYVAPVEHLDHCELPIAACQACSDHYGLKP